mmetsp:Transcript_62831/g.141961  ORF Transcript_62831/g.141961 Transcript_62831/m.141961 type:complete len:570 (-) Transcript_62831:210-1919(-)
MMGALRLLPLLAVACTARNPRRQAPGGLGCELTTAGYVAGLHHVKFKIGTQERFFLLFVPKGYVPRQGIPLWLLAPGAYETPGRFLHVSGMLEFAEQNAFAFAVLQGVKIEGMNVGLHARAIPQLPDDIEYTRAILRDVSQKLCVNMDRIRCTGYSRGARFCSRLASELSSFVKGIAPVAGLRYPNPNNATRPMPIIAIHGTKDRINPYWGKGDPSYWHTSVPDAVNQWSRFNGCKYNKWVRRNKSVVLYQHFDCRDDASVVLVMVQGDGHTWPGSKAFVESQFGYTTDEIDANQVMMQFFMKHPERSICHTTREGELCWAAIESARKGSLPSHPGWVATLSPDATLEEWQWELHQGILADCPRPCDKPDGHTGQEAPVHTTAAPAPVSTASPTTTKLKDTVQAIEGRWMRNTEPGRFTEVIRNGNIHWDVGPVTKITAAGNGKFTTQWQGSTYHARLSGGELIWDDGDVWARVKDGDGENKLFAKKAAVLPIGDDGPWWKSDHHFGTLAVLGAAATCAMGFTAALISIRALRCRGQPLPFSRSGALREEPHKDQDVRALLVAPGDTNI